MPLFPSSREKAAKYGPVADHDDEVEGGGGDHSTKEQKQHHLFKKLYRSSSSISGRTPPPWATYALLAASSLALGLVVGYLGSQWAAAAAALQATAKTLQDFGINPVTPIPAEIFTRRKDVPFIPHRDFMGPSKEASKNWAKLTAASDSIYLPNPSAYGLSDPGIRAPFFIFNEPPPTASEDQENLRNFYVLNNLHELHCVHMIRMRYNSLVYEAETTTPLADTPLDLDWIDHIEHCFEYLRLSVTCGDHMTLESDSPPGSPKEYWEDGLSWGVVHSCIDWDGLMRWQEDMVVAYNETWSRPLV